MSKASSTYAVRPEHEFAVAAHPMTEVERALFNHVNARRVAKGLPALTARGRLVGAAQHHARNMAKLGKMAHVLPGADLPTLADRLRHYGYAWTWAGENVAAGYGLPEEVVKAWMASAGHRANVLRPQFEDGGCGVAEAANGKLYWCMTFGARD